MQQDKLQKVLNEEFFLAFSLRESYHLAQLSGVSQNEPELKGKGSVSYYSTIKSKNPSSELQLDCEEPLRVTEKIIFSLKKSIKNLNIHGKNLEDELNLLTSELKSWKLLKNLIKAKKRHTKVSADSNKLEGKIEFYRKFKELFEGARSFEEIKQKLYSLLDSACPLSQYELIKDIITFDPVLLYMLHIVNWLNKTEEKSIEGGFVPITFTKVKEENPNALLDPDFIFKQDSALDRRMRYENQRLLRQAVNYLRRGMVQKTDDLFERSNLIWRSVIINGGLPYHDFFFADTCKLAPISSNEEFEKFIKDAQAEANDAPILDFMKNKEWSTTLQSRYLNYVSTREETKKGEVFAESMGNPDWLLWIRNCWKRAVDITIDREERLIYAILSSHTRALRELLAEKCEEAWHTSPWIELRGHFQFDVIKRFVYLFKMFNRKIPQTKTHDTEFIDLEKDSPELILKNIFSQPPDPFLTYDKILQELSHPSRVSEKQIVLQLQVLSAALSAVRSHDLSAWDTIVDLLEKYQLDTANMKFDPLKSHKIRFITYYTMVLERAGFLESTNARKIDKIIDIYLKHLIGKEEYQNILELYSYMHDEKAKVDGIAYFLANIQNEVQQVKLKQELDSLLPKGLVDEILSEINHFIDMSNISDPKEYAKKKIASLRWLSLNSSAMDVAVDAASQAIRQFILRDDLESALEVTMTILNKCFEQLKEKDPKGYTNTLLFMSFYSEKESIAGLLECYITHKKIQKVAETYLKGDSEDIVKIQNDFNTQGPLSGLLKEFAGRVRNFLFKADDQRTPYLMFNLKLISQADKNTRRLQDIESIMHGWGIKLLFWTIDLIEKLGVHPAIEELLRDLTDQRSPLLNIISADKQEEILQRISELYGNY